MLQNLSSEVIQCLNNAEDCAKRAKDEPDPKLRRDYFEMELRWLKLAHSYQYAEQLQTFTTHNKQRSRALTQRLEELECWLERHPREKRVSPPCLFYKRKGTGKRQVIVNLILESGTGITRQEIAAAVNSQPNSVSVMIDQINKELAGQGWKIGSINLARRPGVGGGPYRRYRLVRLWASNSGSQFT
jgi:hypothetical protein